MRKKYEADGGLNQNQTLEFWTCASHYFNTVHQEQTDKHQCCCHYSINYGCHRIRKNWREKKADHRTNPYLLFCHGIFFSRSEISSSGAALCISLLELKVCVRVTRPFSKNRISFRSVSAMCPSNQNAGSFPSEMCLPKMGRKMSAGNTSVLFGFKTMAVRNKVFASTVHVAMWPR